MSVVSSLYTGASGLTAHGDAISVVGDNIANANTVGYKSSRANFEDVLAQSVGGNMDIGLGTKLSSVQQILSQGALLGTGVATDLAIKGDGYFAVKGSSAGITGSFYTRAGQFVVDKDGYIVNTGGLKLQGYNVDSTGTLAKTVADIQIPSSTMQPVTTTAVNLVGNLDAGATTPSTAWTTGTSTGGHTTVTNPDSASNFSTSVTVYDSLGEAHSVTVHYRKSTGNDWNWYALVDGGEITGESAGTWIQCADGTLSMNADGTLQSSTLNSNDFDFLNATQNQAITINHGSDMASGGSGLDGMTGFASASNISSVSQDGYGAGTMSGISIGADGKISGVFSNGQQRTVGQVLLADFRSADNLQRVGGNLYIATEKSGDAMVGDPASGGRGTVAAGTLEQSNVDLAKEFVDMIAFQRGFQSNSKIVQTADRMLQDLINLKR